MSITIDTENYIFCAEIIKGYTFRVIIEVLSSIIKRGTIFISQNNLFIMEGNSEKTIIFRIKLKAEFFHKYKYENTKKLRLSVDLIQLKEDLSNVRKKDSLSIFIDNTLDKKIKFKIFSPQQIDDSCQEIALIKYTDNLDYEKIKIPSNKKYYKPYSILSSDFQRIKKITKNANDIIFSMFKNEFCVIRKEVSLSERSIILGKPKSLHNKDELQQEILDKGYEKRFPSNIFNKISKLSILTKTIKFYCPLNKEDPLLIKILSDLGYISIYLKSIYDKTDKSDDEIIISPKKKK